jgi:DNA-binding CsgD family transcriptional regulator
MRCVGFAERERRRKEHEVRLAAHQALTLKQKVEKALARRGLSQKELARLTRGVEVSA